MGSRPMTGRPVVKRPAGPSMIPAMVAAFGVCLISMGFGAYWLSAIGLGASAYYFMRLLIEAGQDLPIESLILVLAALQWIVGPMFDYWGFSHHFKFHMYIAEEDYMFLAVPSVILLSVGLYILRPSRRIAFIQGYAGVTRDIVSRSRRLPLYLIGVGVVFSYMAGNVPDWLDFPVYIFSNIKYIGLIYLLFSEQQKVKKAPLIIAFCLTFMSSLQSAMFHDMLLWSAFVGMYAAYVLKPSMKQKIVLIILAVSFVSVLQIAKDEYRTMLEEQEGGLGLFMAAVDNRLLEERTPSDDNVERLVIRFNQGWIISRIMQVVPTFVPYADGETVVTAIKAAILPRLLFPDKPIAGGVVNFEKYTGFELQSGTSMGISLLGEGYVNFGAEGAWVFMLVFGLLASLVIQGLFRLTQTYPTIWLWLPLVMLHFVKAETELLVQLNFLTKSIATVLFFIWFNRKFLKWTL